MASSVSVATLIDVDNLEKLLSYAFNPVRV